jgi:copper chaperone CopZ
MRSQVVYLLLAISLAAGCERAANDIVLISPETTAVAFNAAGAPTVEFDVPDMMCPEGCGAKTKEILSGQPGAKEVVINFDAKTATVAIDEGMFDAEAAVAAMVDHGFDHTTLKAAGDADGVEETATSGAAAQPAG